MDNKDKRFKIRSLYDYFRDLAHIFANRSSWDRMFCERDKPESKQELLSYYEGYKDGFEKCLLRINEKLDGGDKVFNTDIPEISKIGFDRLLGFTRDRFEHYADAELVDYVKTYEADWELIKKYRKKISQILEKMNKELDENESLL